MVGKEHIKYVDTKHLELLKGTLNRQTRGNQYTKRRKEKDQSLSSGRRSFSQKTGLSKFTDSLLCQRSLTILFFILPSVPVSFLIYE